MSHQMRELPYCENAKQPGKEPPWPIFRLTKANASMSVWQQVFTWEVKVGDILYLGKPHFRSGQILVCVVAPYVYEEGPHKGLREFHHVLEEEYEDVMLLKIHKDMIEGSQEDHNT